ncbi:DUF3592 domain-containing protein [Hymenobacter aerophilus]|uniref:DUF3592 domain-containing protein n=1 Tax=Hymenobacter aerophilus TaxID=119644 RepID=UPI0003609A8A|nr:DUF3592 domain-containing protein [Hymenobacter aerophilus]
MFQKATLILWLRAWVLFPVSVALLLAFLGLAVSRWRTLHGTAAIATVQALPGKVGSGKSSLYEVIIRYSQPQQGVQTARIITTSSIFNKLTLDMKVTVRYAAQQSGKPMLDSEWSFSGLMLIWLPAVLLFFFDGWAVNKAWRRRRPDGYLPN